MSRNSLSSITPASDWFRRGAARHVAELTTRLTTDLAAVEANPRPKAIHRARVGLRRLRIALGFVMWPGNRKALKRGRAELRRLARLLGAARDLDVQYGNLQRIVLNSTPVTDNPEVRRRLKKQRHTAARQAQAACARLRRNETLRIFIAAMRPGSVGRRRKQPDTSAASAAAAVSLRVSELLVFKLKIPPDYEQLHALRIAVKRVRYALECIVAVTEHPLPAQLLLLREMQDALGSMHDAGLCDNAVVTDADQRAAVRRWVAAQRRSALARFRPLWRRCSDRRWWRWSARICHGLVAITP